MGVGACRQPLKICSTTSPMRAQLVRYRQARVSSTGSGVITTLPHWRCSSATAVDSCGSSTKWMFSRTTAQCPSVTVQSTEKLMTFQR